MRGMRRGSRASVASLIAALGLLLTISSVSALSGFVNPTSGAPGSQVLVSGAAWPVGLDLRVMWDDGTTVLGNTKVDASGAFALQVTIPSSATAGEHDLRLTAWKGQYIPACIAVNASVKFVVASGSEPTATVDPAATATATSTAPVVATITDPACVAATATATSSATATATSTSSVTATATRTPTKTKLPPTGSAGLLNDDDGDSSTSTYVAVVLLGAGIALTGAYVLRQRRSHA